MTFIHRPPPHLCVVLQKSISSDKPIAIPTTDKIKKTIPMAHAFCSASFSFFLIAASLAETSSGKNTIITTDDGNEIDVDDI